MNKWLYGLACLLPSLLIAAAFGWLTLWGQDHHERDCRRYVAAHVTTDIAAWDRLVCR